MQGTSLFPQLQDIGWVRDLVLLLIMIEVVDHLTMPKKNSVDIIVDEEAFVLKAGTKIKLIMLESDAARFVGGL
jgi:hypothetical protein